MSSEVDSMEDKKYTIESIRARYGETDMMGHVYYANYLYWFEQARSGWCRERGTTYKEIEEMGYLLPVVEVNVSYKSEVKYDDVVEVKIWATEVKRTSFQFRYEVYNTVTGKISTVGSSWHVLVDKTMKPIAIPAEIQKLFEA